MDIENNDPYNFEISNDINEQEQSVIPIKSDFLENVVSTVKGLENTIKHGIDTYENISKMKNETELLRITSQSQIENKKLNILAKELKNQNCTSTLFLSFVILPISPPTY